MPLIIETGAIVPNANSYVTLEEANAYMEYSATRVLWAAMTDPDKEAAIVQATRAMDATVTWKGDKVRWDQPRQWPRTGVQIDTGGIAWNPLGSNYAAQVPADTIPQAIKEASIELASMMAQGDRTADPDSAGIKSVKLGKGALEVEFDPSTTPQMLGRLPPALLNDYMEGYGRNRIVKVHRV